MPTITNIINRIALLSSLALVSCAELGDIAMVLGANDANYEQWRLLHNESVPASAEVENTNTMLASKARSEAALRQRETALSEYEKKLLPALQAAEKVMNNETPMQTTFSEYAMLISHYWFMGSYYHRKANFVSAKRVLRRANEICTRYPGRGGTQAGCEMVSHMKTEPALR